MGVALNHFPFTPSATGLGMKTPLALHFECLFGTVSQVNVIYLLKVCRTTSAVIGQQGSVAADGNRHHRNSRKEMFIMLLIGIDQSPKEHYVCIMDVKGSQLAQLSIPNNAAGFTKLHTTCQEFGIPAHDCLVAIECWDSDLLASGMQLGKSSCIPLARSSESQHSMATRQSCRTTACWWTICTITVTPSMSFPARRLTATEIATARVARAVMPAMLKCWLTCSALTESSTSRGLLTPL